MKRHKKIPPEKSLQKTFGSKMQPNMGMATSILLKPPTHLPSVYAIIITQLFRFVKGFFEKSLKIWKKYFF